MPTGTVTTAYDHYVVMREAYNGKVLNPKDGDNLTNWSIFIGSDLQQAQTNIHAQRGAGAGFSTTIRTLRKATQYITWAEELGTGHCQVNGDAKKIASCFSQSCAF